MKVIELSYQNDSLFFYIRKRGERKRENQESQ